MTSKTVYQGEPGWVVNVINSSGKSRLLRHVILHSPTGFAWGYGGSGPADLALSILCDLLRERPSERRLYFGQYKAQPHYQAFKREFVARWDFGGGFKVDSETIIDWLRQRGLEV